MTSSILNQLMDKIREELPGLESNEDTDQINRHFENTEAHVRAKKESDSMYEDVKV